MMPMNSGTTPSSTLHTPFSSKLRMRFALMKIWSVSDVGRRMRHAVP